MRRWTQAREKKGKERERERERKEIKRKEAKRGWNSDCIVSSHDDPICLR